MPALLTCLPLGLSSLMEQPVPAACSLMVSEVCSREVAVERNDSSEIECWISDVKEKKKKNPSLWVISLLASIAASLSGNSQNKGRQ